MKTKPRGGLYVVRDGRRVILTVIGRSGTAVEVELTAQSCAVVRSLLHLWGASVESCPSLSQPMAANVEVRILPPEDLSGRWPSDGV